MQRLPRLLLLVGIGIVALGGVLLLLGRQLRDPALLSEAPVPIPFLQNVTAGSSLKGTVTLIGSKGSIPIYRVDFDDADSQPVTIDRMYLAYVNGYVAGTPPFQSLPLDLALFREDSVRDVDYFGYKYTSQSAATEIANQGSPSFTTRFPGQFFASARARANDASNGNQLQLFEQANGIAFLATDRTTPGAITLDGNSLYVFVINEIGLSAMNIQPLICGDGWKMTAEACDDSNTLSGDGCSISCAVEVGWQCIGNPSACTPLATCGNGAIESGEACDDGGVTGGDGCSATCQVESGWTCTGQPSICTQDPVPPVCGNGAIESGEACDDGDATGSDGCSATCQVENGYTCSGQPSVCSLLCGNGAINVGEECDDGNTDQTDNCRFCTIFPPLPFGGGSSSVASSAGGATPPPPMGGGSASSSIASSVASSTASSVASSAASSVATLSLSNVAYGSDLQQRFDVLSPSAGPPTPVVVAVHGGEWYQGDKAETNTVFGNTLALNGYARVSINYRLVSAPPASSSASSAAPMTNQFPTAIRDLDCALRTIRQNALTYNIDPTRIILFGQSAGAQIAGMLAYNPEVDWHDPSCPVQDPTPITIRGLFSGGGVFHWQDVPSNVFTIVQNYLGPLWDPACAANRTLAPCTWDPAAPIMQATAGDPPARLYSGDNDTTVNRTGVNNSVDFANALQSVGVTANAMIIPGVHKAFLTTFPTSPSLQQDVLTFLQSVAP